MGNESNLVQTRGCDFIKCFLPPHFNECVCWVSSDWAGCGRISDISALRAGVDVFGGGKAERSASVCLYTQRCDVYGDVLSFPKLQALAKRGVAHCAPPD